MGTEIQEIGERRPPESWTQYGVCKLKRKTSVIQGENPIWIESRSREDAEAAYREAQQWLSPLPPERLIGLLGELNLKTIPRAEDGDDREGRFRLYARELQAFPGDVVRDCLRNWPDKFFPAWTELRDAIAGDRRIKERRQRVDALRKFLNGEQGGEPLGPPPTDQQIQRMRDHFAPDKPPPLSPEKLARLAEVDRVHGAAAKAKTKTTFNRLNQRGE